LIKKTVLILLSALFLFIGCEIHDVDQGGNLVPKTVDQDSDFRHTITINGKKLRERKRDENPDNMHEYAYEVNGTDLYIQTYGDITKPVIIVLHGGPGGGDLQYMLGLNKFFDNYSLSDDYFMVFFDQRGGGISKRHDNMDELVAEMFLKDLESLVDLFSPNRKVSLIGHSWGGMLGGYFLSEHVDKVDGIVFVEPGPFNSEISKEFPTLEMNLGPTDEFVNDILWQHQFISPNKHEILDYYFIAGVQKGAAKAYHINQEDPYPIWRIGAFLTFEFDKYYQDREWSASENFDKFEGKVLFINGDLNERMSIEIETTHQMSLFKDAEMKVTTGGHDSIWHDAKTHVKYIKDYLNEIQAGGVE